MDSASLSSRACANPPYLSIDLLSVFPSFIETPGRHKDTSFMNTSDLNTYLDKHIGDLCKVGYKNNSDNHCAHFVSHVLGISSGTTCKNMVRSSETGASIRVHELFPLCPTVGKWSDLSTDTQIGLVFILNAGNVNLKTKTMANVPKKHVGIFCRDSGNNKIWHYSNSKNKVVSQTPEEFSKHYSSPNNAMFWGTLPNGSVK